MMKAMLFSLACYIPMSGASDEVNIRLAGKITPRCEFSTAAESLLFDATGFANTELTINCNAPIKIALLSKNGGLRHQQSNLIEAYFFTMKLPGSDMDITEQAKDLMLEKSYVIDEIFFDTTAQLEFQLEKPLLFAGEYNDVLRIEVTPSALIGGI
ncbi:hypothetical protein [Pseudoalteromonas sp. KAN5]|uniref:hypothetical protein n=1 Tax=Pseudoalteromonas sp. KAN5 TaxID=2916633 RepID=UPI001FCAE86E|nr:hypothetical protein [Pseudoalteromonas sp. KAN5]BDF94932.1 hypothetical protein KAN5_17700 [Pseudoalteromonas sp. KAN5]